MTAGLSPLVTRAFWLIAAALLLIGAVVLYRAYRGPTIQDRLIAVNVAATNTVIVVAIVAVALGHYGMLDVALAYALLNFLLSVGVARLVERGWI